MKHMLASSEKSAGRAAVTYGEGDWFAVPLRHGGFASGVIARSVPRQGRILIGYFFGPRRATIPQLEELAGLAPSDAILVRRFGDLALLRGTWPLLGKLPGWERAVWPTPAFRRFEELTGRSFKVIYDDADPSKLVREEIVDRYHLAAFAKDGLLGAGAVEVMLTGLLR